MSPKGPLSSKPPDSPQSAPETIASNIRPQSHDTPRQTPRLVRCHRPQAARSTAQPVGFRHSMTIASTFFQSPTTRGSSRAPIPDQSVFVRWPQRAMRDHKVSSNAQLPAVTQRRQRCCRQQGFTERSPKGVCNHTGSVRSRQQARKLSQSAGAGPWDLWDPVRCRGIVFQVQSLDNRGPNSGAEGKASATPRPNVLTTRRDSNVSIQVDHRRQGQPRPHVLPIACGSSRDAHPGLTRKPIDLQVVQEYDGWAGSANPRSCLPRTHRVKRPPDLRHGGSRHPPFRQVVLGDGHVANVLAWKNLTIWEMDQ